MDSYRVIPYGGELVNLVTNPERAQALKTLSRDLQTITLTSRQLSDLELLMNGAFSPLKGFMTSADYESVIDRMRLQDGTLWPIPICLDVSEAEAGRLEVGGRVEGQLAGAAVDREQAVVDAATGDAPGKGVGWHVLVGGQDRPGVGLVLGGVQVRGCDDRSVIGVGDRDGD